MIGSSKDAWLIVGLGSPGREYERSRHNCGFRAIDRLADRLSCKIDKARFQGLYGKVLYGGKVLYLLKPLTYMNLSGQSVLQLSAYFQIPPQRIIVLFDDISLEPGRLGSEAFPRVKIGVGAKPNPDYDLAAWVLGAFPPAEEKAVSAALDAAGDAALTILDKGVPEAANRFNGFHP